MEETTRPRTHTVEELVAAVDEQTSCICFFGGDPSPQAPFSLRAARRAREKAGGRILRICWETNGTMHPSVLDVMVDTALRSGGNLKFDLKAWDENLHIALTGVSNRRTLDNLARAAGRIGERVVPPLRMASTLLIPGYISVQEVRDLARFIASIDRDIPYSLLAFHPHFHMADLPLTSRRLPPSRYLYTEPVGKSGKLTLDFNFSYSPPCAFTESATCTFAPSENNLPFRVEAGEIYRG